MGNNKPAVEKKKRKKGRPSLLDLQKRTLKQQQQHQYQRTNPSPDPDPNPNPYLRFPPRRSPAPSPADDDDDGDDDDDEDDSGDRRQKKIKLVHHLPHLAAGDKAKGRNFSTAMDDCRDSGPTTPLPDEKLLVFILDRLQKKDTYGVFSEPVDPNELPDYHDVIACPMDFGTVRKKLSSGAYANLEEFEKDVFLISSNAMSYNAPDTIYFRQARTIHELAKKDFESLRRESDDSESEPKVPRRGRPPSKNTLTKRPVGRPPADRASDFSAATLANTGDGNSIHDLARRGQPGTSGMSTRASLGLRNIERISWTGEHKAERSEEYSGSLFKGTPTRYGKKPIIVDENRRNTYRQPQPSSISHEPPISLILDGEQQLVPVWPQTEHAYARSLARFASNLGPIGWAIAAKRIEKALPSGTKFGPGWVGDCEAPQQYHPPLLSASPHPFSLPNIFPCNTVSRGDKLPQRPEPPSNESASTSNGPSDPMEAADPSRRSESEAGPTPFKAPFQLQRNGFSTPFGFNLASQLAQMVRPNTLPGLDTVMTHGRALDLVSRGGSSFVHQGKSGPPDLNVHFQTPGSPASGVLVDSQHPDLALQL